MRRSANWWKGFISRSTRSWRLPARPLVPVALFCLTGIAILDRFDLSFFHPPLSSDLQSLVGEKGKFEGTILEPFEARRSGSKGLVSVETVNGRVVPPAKMELKLSFVPSWERGDRIRFETRPKRPVRYQNPGSFNYRRYLERKGILLSGFIAAPDRVEKIGEKEALTQPLRWLDGLRKGTAMLFSQNIPAPTAGFLTALVVGDRSGMTEELWEDFRRTGTAHVVAISGQHIGMIAAVFYFLFLWILKRSVRLILSLSVRKIAGLLTLLPIFFYTFLAGAPPSALRAALLFLCIVFALLMEREVDPFSALAAGAIGIMLIDRSAPFSASFQLSFLAVLGILLFRRKGVRRNFFNKYIVDPFWMTFGASLATAPLVAYLFHQVSISGVLTNLWAIPFSGFLLIFASLSLVSHWIIPPLGQLLLPLCGTLAGWFLTGIHLSSRISWVISFYPSGFQIFVVFLMVGLLALLRWRPQLLRTVLAGGGTLILILLLSEFLPAAGRKSLEVTFLDVGQGDSCLVRTPAGGNLLVDGGGFLIPGKGPPPFDIGREVVVPYLKRRGIKKIDRILLSHPHPDHYGGLTAVVEEFPVGEFWWNGQTFPDETFDTLFWTLDQKKVPGRILKEGDRLQWDGLEVEVLYPRRIERSRSINDNSLVVRLTFGEARILFPGDIEEEGEQTLRDSSGLQAEVLKIPHHASKTSSSVPFIDSVHPQFAVGSLGEGNFFGFPHPGVLEKYERRGVKVFRTDRNGAVTVTVPPDFPTRPISIRTVSSGE